MSYSSINSARSVLSAMGIVRMSYSSINSPRSVLSAMGIVRDGVSVGSHPIVIRFMKGIYNLRPPVSRYVQTWDVNIVLNKLRNLSPVKYISLKVLSMKLAMILCLVLAGRTQLLYLLTIEIMLKEQNLMLYSIVII